MFLPAMSGAEPCVACAIAYRSPTHETRRETEPADESRALVGEDVAELVGRHDDVVLLRLHDELHREAVDQHFFELDIRIVLRHLAAFFGEHPAHEPVHGLLVDGGHFPALSRARDLERFACDAARAFACYDA